MIWTKIGNIARNAWDIWKFEVGTLLSEQAEILFSSELDGRWWGRWWTIYWQSMRDGLGRIGPPGGVRPFLHPSFWDSAPGCKPLGCSLWQDSSPHREKAPGNSPKLGMNLSVVPTSGAEQRLRARSACLWNKLDWAIHGLPRILFRILQTAGGISLGPELVMAQAPLCLFTEGQGGLHFLCVCLARDS